MVENYWLSLFLLIIFGMSMSSRYYVGYTYNIELQPKSHYVLVSTSMFLGESITYLIICGYYWQQVSSW